MIARTLYPQVQSVTEVRVGCSQQDGDAQQEEVVPLFLPQLNSLHDAYIVRGEDAFNVDSIPDHHRLTHQILVMWQHFKDRKQTFVRIPTDVYLLLWYKTMSWLGQIRPYHRDEARPDSL